MLQTIDPFVSGDSVDSLASGTLLLDPPSDLNLVALPQDAEETEPSFHHHEAGVLPLIERVLGPSKALVSR